MAATSNDRPSNTAANDRPLDTTSNDRPPGPSPDDPSRTMRSGAGEGLVDMRNWPGYVLVAAGMLALACALTAAGYGYRGWTMLSGVACGVLLLAGVGLVVLEHRRVSRKRRESADSE